MNEESLVSICIPSYNHAQFLPYCIESVLSQTYPNIEIIIIDDGSKDNSLEIARGYAAKYSNKIRVHTHPNRENRGISNTVNLGFNASKGKYWCGLPSDDALCEDKIEKQVAYLEANPEIGFVYSYGDYIDIRGEKLPGRFGKDITKESDPLQTLLVENLIPGMTVLARRDAMEQVGLHDPDLIYSDWDFWIRFFTLYKGGFIPESLVEYRVHNYNTSLGVDPAVIYDHIRKVLLKLQTSEDEKLSRLQEPVYQKLIADNLSKLHIREATSHLDNYFTAVAAKDFANARSALKKAFKTAPQIFLRPRRSAAVLKYLLLTIKS